MGQDRTELKEKVPLTGGKSKTRGIVNKNKQQKHVAFYSVVYACMYNF
jgi:hypothetical protein